MLNLAAVQAFYGTDTVHPLAPPNAPAHVHEHERLREKMLSWYCAQPDHDVTTAACEIREHRVKLSTVTDPDERKALNDEHKDRKSVV